MLFDFSDDTPYQSSRLVTRKSKAELLCHNCLEFSGKYSCAISLSLFHFRESLVDAIPQVQSTLSSEEPSSGEAQSDTQGNSSSLGLPGEGPKRAETFHTLLGPEVTYV